MGYTTVPDKTAGDPFTESMWDVYVRDNINVGVMRMLADTTLGASAASIDFTSIPATFGGLLLELYLRDDHAVALSAASLRLNNDSGANYDYEVFDGQGASLAAAETFAATAINIGNVPGNTAGANLFSSHRVEIPHYAGAANNKSLLAQYAEKHGTATGNLFVGSRSGHWRSNAAINRVTILPASGNFVAGSRATLYGLPV